MKASRTISDPVFERYYVEASRVMATRYPCWSWPRNWWAMATA